MPEARVRRQTPKPKFWIADPAARQSFGKVLNLDWAATEGDQAKRAQIDAARMQHRIAVHVRRYLDHKRDAGEDGWTLPQVAARLSTMDYDSLMRVLRGDMQMTLLHVADLRAEIGNVVVLASEVKQL